MTEATRLQTPDDLAALRARVVERRSAKKVCVSICAGTGCRAQGSMELLAEFGRQLESAGLDDVELRATGCHGFCERGPLVVIHPRKIFYHSVQMKHVADIIDKTIQHDEVLPALLFRDPKTKQRCEVEGEVPFYAKQQRIVFRHNGIIDPTDIEDYVGADGYVALAKVLAGMTPEQVCDEVEASGLRGRGGGGFPTGKKWQICRNQPGETKYVICNGDEGDPGAFMDRSIMEGDPHAVLEGMTIGAYAIGASKGYLYVRGEYPLAVANLNVAIEQAKTRGLLGDDIFGSGFNFTVEIVRGAGAFVCGEETGLIASIEGDIGTPRQRPPYPAESGLWGKPTNINNVETWTNVPVILERGASWFASIGTEGSKGTKVFSLVGKVNNTGLVEVPMGATLREIVFDIGGGIQKKRKFKAVQTGGPSGGCIPESLLDLPVDFDKLREVGAMMGSGGLIVMDERTCMVDVAKYFLGFLVGESCGRCAPCREGVFQMHRILSRIVEGEGREGDLETLEKLGNYVKASSLCQLGGTAPNPVLSTLRYFRHEYEAHIKEKKCRAGICKELVQFRIDPETCTGCTLCRRDCPTEAITGAKKEPHRIDAAQCIKCGVCYDVCNFGAVEVE
ncbi:MAG: 4Fe-4S dicluster domain-containing protein [Nitrospiraceae bacterium]|nr:4Fe-4S dicluster domain-containing protein [Nitrospiraceae bacterium]